MASSVVALEHGQTQHLLAFAARAKVPEARIDDTGERLTITVQAPGAEAHNTEVRWDEIEQQLFVGVWRAAPATSPSSPPAELAWFRSFHLPQCGGAGGARAHITVEGGAIRIALPKGRRTLSDPLSGLLPPDESSGL
jgi:hypothetical protein